MKHVTIIDYDAGNLFSLKNAFEHIGANVTVTKDKDVILKAGKLILPGVGAFGSRMAELQAMDMVDAIHNYVAAGKPLLGICLGMQLLFESSTEFGDHKGLGLLPGSVKAIPETGPDGTYNRVPHTGWEELARATTDDRWRDSILGKTTTGSSFYFVHSFSAHPEDADQLANVIVNGNPITAAVMRKNITGLQFHPEKSGPHGLDILRAFLYDK